MEFFTITINLPARSRDLTIAGTLRALVVLLTFQPKLSSLKIILCYGKPMAKELNLVMYDVRNP